MLPEVMAQTAAEMRTSLAKTRAAISHNLSSGEANEETVRQFLRKHLPSSIGVTKGQIIDSHGGQSRQADVILYSTQRTPMLFTSEEDSQQVVPSEGVIAVIEIKTQIHAGDLDGVITHMQSVKSLDKSAYFPTGSIVVNTTKIYDKEYSAPPTLYFVFAYESGQLERIAHALNEKQAGLPVDRRIDSLAVLDRGMVLNATGEGNVSGIPSPTTSMAAYDSSNALLMFYLLISPYLLQYQFDAIKLQAYIPGDFRF